VQENDTQCRDKPQERKRPCPVCLKLYSSKALNQIILAGLLTCSIFETSLPFLYANSGLSVVQRLWRSLQQRVCSGFTPDSLFIFSVNTEKDTKTGAKTTK
jgi:hypothetical protein